MYIGNVEIKDGAILAPMAGITDIAFRTLCKTFGASLLVTEMISSKGLFYGDEKTERYMRTESSNKPIAIQIFGSDAEIMSRVVENQLNKRDDFAMIDINMGCPAPKIVKNGDGSALMRNTKLAVEIVKKIKKISNKPLTVKMRKGFNDKEVNAVEFAMALEDAGVDAVTVHGRTREQFYTGKSDMEIIKNVKEKLSIPVIANGDIFSYDDYVNLLEYTNCDAAMVARGSLGNPWIFKSIIEKKEYIPNAEERLIMLKRHAKLLSEYVSEHRCNLEMRKHASWYIKGLKYSSEMRNRINKTRSLEEMYDILDEYVEKLIKDRA